SPRLACLESCASPVQPAPSPRPRLAGLCPLHSRSLPWANYLALAAAWNRLRRELIVVSRCFSIAPALGADGMPGTELFMGPPLHRTPTIRPSLSWRCLTANSTQLFNAPLTTWHQLPRLLRHHGVSRGRFLLSPRTAGRLLSYTVLLLHFLISQVSRTPERSR